MWFNRSPRDEAEERDPADKQCYASVAEGRFTHLREELAPQKGDERNRARPHPLRKRNPEMVHGEDGADGARDPQRGGCRRPPRPLPRDAGNEQEHERRENNADAHV